MILLDLFSGIGGFHLGLEQAGFKFDKVGFSEIDKYAIQIYKKHFPESIELGGIENVTTKEVISRIGKPNLITFGFPCQDLSVAGKRKGIEGDTRSGLFFEAIRLIDGLQPEFFIFENVKGLFSSNEGRDFETVLRTITDIGYSGQWQLLNTKWFLPQNRERIYFVGYSTAGSRPEIFPITKSIEVFRKRSIEKHRGRQSSRENTNSLRGCGELKIPMIQCFTQDRKELRYHTKIGESPCLKDRMGTGGNNVPMICNTVTPDAYLTRGARDRDKNGKAILTSMHKRRIRRLTPTECERLQGFPDGWTAELSDTQRYKTLGNAVSIPVVKAVGERLIKESLKYIAEDKLREFLKENPDEIYSNMFQIFIPDFEDFISKNAVELEYKEQS